MQALICHTYQQLAQRSGDNLAPICALLPARIRPLPTLRRPFSFGFVSPNFGLKNLQAPPVPPTKKSPAHFTRSPFCCRILTFILSTSNRPAPQINHPAQIATLTRPLTNPRLPCSYARESVANSRESLSLAPDFNPVCRPTIYERSHCRMVTHLRSQVSTRPAISRKVASHAPPAQTPRA